MADHPKPKLKWPATKEELTAAGYEAAERAQCSGRRCQEQIWWWKTPKGKRMPLHETEPGKYQPHFADCIDTPEFRR